jgi:hypothetical protein
MCCDGKSAKQAYAPTGTWLDRTDKDTFTAAEIAAAEGCGTRTILRAIDRGEFGPLVYWVGESVRIPRLAVVHFQDGSRQRRRQLAQQ